MALQWLTSVDAGKEYTNQVNITLSLIVKSTYISVAFSSSGFSGFDGILGDWFL
ncbi:hypothetical protein EDD18DRAFT_1368417 [Armillaria luteobubalina]|uniref:Uncharacterized protein n=1 Tax=Armillaria luteobubalina TaxID=153913 RepID=A0AA39NXS8_9AGAR|nr:hypothetical protein EDD18DRAFT_1368417 [Armillaria luteobubalina]